MSFNNAKPWGGRFTANTDEFVEIFTESVSCDQRLYPYDIIGSVAHVKMLAKVGVLTQPESDQITAALHAIKADMDAGRFNWSVALEDVHMNIETELINRIGETGKKLHTGRSRNDQVATDMRLYLIDETQQIQALIAGVLGALVDIAEIHSATIMPGFTHMQVAQPVTFGHHLLAWCEMLLRDRERLRDCGRRLNVSPLGSAALAGTGFPIDRRQTAEELGFSDVIHNSMDGVSDRDFVIEFIAACSLIMMHLSRWSEEIILWTSPAFEFIELGDAWCTGSSIMPQKKNPDIPELVRGKTARVYGALMTMLSLMKAQPLAYNRDNQEDKRAVFDTVDTVKMCLTAYAGMVPTITVNSAGMYAMAADGYSTATDLADYLAAKGVPFREAHSIVGEIVGHAIREKNTLEQLSLQELRSFSDKIEQDIYACLSLEGSVRHRNHVGGTAPRQVAMAVTRIRQQLHATKESRTDEHRD